MELAGLGVFIAAAVVIPLLGGLRLGEALGSPSAGFIAGLLLGMVAAAAGVYTRMKRSL